MYVFWGNKGQLSLFWGAALYIVAQSKKYGQSYLPFFTRNMFISPPSGYPLDHQNGYQTGYNT